MGGERFVRVRVRNVRLSQFCGFLYNLIDARAMLCFLFHTLSIYIKIEGTTTTAVVVLPHIAVTKKAQFTPLAGSAAPSCEPCCCAFSSFRTYSFVVLEYGDLLSYTFASRLYVRLFFVFFALFVVYNCCRRTGMIVALPHTCRIPVLMHRNTAVVDGYCTFSCVQQ